MGNCVEHGLFSDTLTGCPICAKNNKVSPKIRHWCDECESWETCDIDCPNNQERYSQMIRRAGALDVQEGGDHYSKHKIQPIEYIHANGLDFLSGNIIKYATRHKDKNGAEDIRKIIHYAELILELEYGEGR